MNKHEVEMSVVWNGELDRKGFCPSLLGERVSKPAGFWTEPPRLYNKKAEFWQTRIPKGKESTLKEALRQSDEDEPTSWLDKAPEDGDDSGIVGPDNIAETEEEGGSDEKS